MSQRCASNVFRLTCSARQTKTDKGLSFLSQASGHAGIVEWLLSVGADVTLKGGVEMHACWQVVRSAHCDCKSVQLDQNEHMHLILAGWARLRS